MFLWAGEVAPDILPGQLWARSQHNVIGKVNCVGTYFNVKGPFVVVKKINVVE